MRGAVLGTGKPPHHPATFVPRLKMISLPDETTTITIALYLRVVRLQSQLRKSRTEHRLP